MRPDSWKDVRRVLLIRLDNIGDVIMTGPSVRTLRRALPGAHLTYLVSPAGSRIAPLLPGIDTVIAHRAVWQDAGRAMPFDPEREQDAVRSIRAGSFDAAVILTSFSQSVYPPAYLCYLAGIPRRIGQSREFGGSLLTTWVRALSDGAHQTDRSLHLLKSEGFEPEPPVLELNVPGHDRERVGALLAAAGIDAGKPYLVLAPGASCQTRRYPAERFTALAGGLARVFDLPIVLAGTEGEEALIRSILSSLPPGQGLSLAGRTSIGELCALVSGASLVVTHNSACMHIADAFRRPQVALYSGADLRSQYEPRNSPAVLLGRPVPCAPCYRFDCPFGLECLDVDPEEAVEAARGLLAPSVHVKATGRSLQGREPALAAVAGTRSES